jgi:hypothetical protein
MAALVRRDEIEVEALVTDRYVESLLAAHARRADDVPSLADLDPVLRSTARRLSADLVRPHPSFRFEDALSQQLAAIAAGIVEAVPGRTVAEPGVLEPISLDAYRAIGPGRPPAEARGGDAVAPERPPASRPLLVGGAVASAALSIAGAAVIAWRLGVVDPARLERVARVAGRISVAALPQARGRVH